MCGRFRQTRSQKQLGERFQAEGEVEVVPRFNIAPTQPVVTVNIPRWQWRSALGCWSRLSADLLSRIGEGSRAIAPHGLTTVPIESPTAILLPPSPHSRTHGSVPDIRICEVSSGCG